MSAIKIEEQNQLNPEEHQEIARDWEHDALKASQSYQKSRKQITTRDQPSFRVQEVRERVRKNRGNQKFASIHQINQSEGSSLQASKSIKSQIGNVEEVEPISLGNSIKKTYPSISQIKLPSLPGHQTERKSTENHMNQQRERAFATDFDLNKERSLKNTKKFDYSSPVVTLRAQKYLSGSSNDTYGSTLEKTRKKSIAKKSLQTYNLNYIDYQTLQARGSYALLDSNKELGRIFEESAVAEKQIQSSRNISKTTMDGGLMSGILGKIQKAKEGSHNINIGSNKNLNIHNAPTNIYFQRGFLKFGEILNITIQYEQNKKIVQFQKEKVINQEKKQ